MTVELPRRLLADRCSVVTITAAAAAVETTLAGYPDAPTGLGVGLAVVLALWQWRVVRARPRSLEIGAERVVLHAGHGRRVPATLAPGARLLAGTLVLPWRSAGRRQSVWLTQADLRRESLRALAVRLVAGASPRGP